MTTPELTPDEVDGAIERLCHPDATYNPDALTVCAEVDALRKELDEARHALNYARKRITELETAVDPFKVAANRIVADIETQIAREQAGQA